MRPIHAGLLLVALGAVVVLAGGPGTAQSVAAQETEGAPPADRAAQQDAARRNAARGGAPGTTTDDPSGPENGPGQADVRDADQPTEGDPTPDEAPSTPVAATPSPVDPGLNPLATLARDSLKGFRERPLFTPSRRAPQPAPTAEPPPEAEPAPVEEAEAPPTPQPNLKLTGVLEGPDDAVAVVQDLDSNTMTQLRPGDMLNGWLVTSVEGVTLTLTLGDRDEQYRLFDPNRKEPASEPDEP